MTELNQIAGIPLYIKIRESILEQIKNGELSIGQKLPNEIELAQDFGVSRMTVRRAVEELVRDGILQRTRGKGTFVIGQKMTRHFSRLTGFVEEAAEQGLEPRSQLLSFKVIPASKELCGYLNIEKSARVYSIKRLRFLGKERIAIHYAFIPCQLIDHIEKDQLETGSLYKVYSQNKLPVIWAKQRIESQSSTSELANYLGLKTGTPILYSERITYSSNDLPIEWGQAYYNAALYSIEVILQRDGF
jgi:GntR family transcriptional regulator